LLLITQDRALAHDIRQLKDQRSVNSDKDILVVRLNKSGQAVEWYFQEARVGINDKFEVCEVPIKQNKKRIKISEIPSVGDYVFCTHFGKSKLIKLIGEGGEGKIFETKRGHACKIYHQKQLMVNTQAKLELMLTKPIRKKGICWPLDIVKNRKDEFCGYLMQKAVGIPVQKGIFHKPLLKKHFPHWTRKSLVNLSITILDKIRFLHARNVLIGDLNPLNILIDTEEIIYFVDTDSYQVGSYPCPVGMVNYTAPEIQLKNFRSFLRTIEHERFAVATLLFMILLPGKTPYSHQGGGSPVKNIKDGIFSYPLGEKSNQKTPDGPWRFIWSNLPYKTKKAFYECFAHNNRPLVNEWISVMKHYMNTLNHGNVTDKIYPTKFKPVSEHAKQEYGAEARKSIDFTCDDCGKKFSVDEATAHKMKKWGTKSCYSCYSIRRQATVDCICDKCGEMFKISYDKAEREENSDKLCKACIDKRRLERQTGDWIICSECGKSFLYSIRDQKYFAKKGFLPPKRCKPCRKIRKSRSSDSIFGRLFFK
jgi:serine/threonine protein kinase